MVRRCILFGALAACLAFACTQQGLPVPDEGKEEPGPGPLPRTLNTIDMKTLHKILLISLSLALTACGKEDATKDYGFARVYIPQATVTGIDNSYPIPLGPFYRNSVYSCSYDDASGSLEIVLGVIRSGYFAHQQAYSVTLGVSEALTSAKVAALETAGTPVAALPAELCTIPAIPGTNWAVSSTVIPPSPPVRELHRLHRLVL